MIEIPPYIGDDAFRAFLEEEDCFVTLDYARMRFLGDMIGPLGKSDVYPLVEEFFDYDIPYLPDESEFAGLITNFLGLWNEVESWSRQVPVKLSSHSDITTHDQVAKLTGQRIDEILHAFLDGIWGEERRLPLSMAMASTLTAIEEDASIYDDIFAQTFKTEDDGGKDTSSVAELLARIAEVDARIEDHIASLIKTFRDKDYLRAIKHKSRDYPLLKQAKRLVHELDDAKGLPKDTIRECLSRNEELAPVFVNILSQVLTDRFPADHHQGSLFFIIHMLGEMEEKRAFPVLLDLLEHDYEMMDELLDDGLTESLPGVLISTYDDNPKPLYRIMDNLDHNETLTSISFDAWRWLVASGKIALDEAHKYLASCHEAIQPLGEHHIWSIWVETVAELGLDCFAEQAREAFRKNKVPKFYLDLADFEDMLAEAQKAESPTANLEKWQYGPFTDTIGTLSRWHGFSKEYLQEQEKIEREAAMRIQRTQPGALSMPALNPNKMVGRNDPCPCGSGQKYKKCCLH